MRGRILSGIRPTGTLHIGHLSVLENWVKLQEEYETYFMVADWHALTTSFDETQTIRGKTRDMLLDWFAIGIDPEKSAVFVQSQVPQHAEMHLLFSMITPLSWVERVPTYKDQIQQLGEQGKDINTYGFLGYPVLMAADILVYRADTVPVGEDQVPHLEFTRELARRFNYLYNAKVFPEPQPKLAKLSVLPGIDGRKMSKSYHNDVAITGPADEFAARIKLMVTDPQRIRKTDKGNPEVCTVYTYHSMYDAPGLDETEKACRAGEIGCVECKKRLAKIMDLRIAPIREKRHQLEQNPDYVEDVINEGAKKARAAADATLDAVYKAMGM